MKFCKNQKHLGQQLFGYCKLINCNSKLRTYCDKCKQNHEDHPQDLYQLDNIQSIYSSNQQNTMQLGLFYKDLQQFMIEIQKVLCQIDLNNNQKMNYQNQNVLLDQINLMLQTQNVLNQILPICYTIRNEWNQVIQELSNLHFNQKSFQEIQQQNTEIKKQKTIKKQETKFQQLSEKQNQFQTKQNWENLQIHFSQEFKYKWIKILNDGLMAQNEDDRGMVICDPMLPRKGKYQFAFGISENAYLIWIGICHKEIVMQSNYTTDFKSDNEKGIGVYLINNYGVTNSHINAEINNLTNSFFFEPNDLIVVQVDMDFGIIIWQSKISNNQYSMKFDKNQDVHPCAGITAFSPIQIIENF
ncbi:unnamed protein product [Paramecium sonneborni]|uniref:B30.2/SPRY domain-containing protein n=1 Tax=Paramecium sonneborni TaxID=65129 RepID=A0A8S1Q793_9CILI|nr:unnamed protein product [Paramecium sonneborni]